MTDIENIITEPIEDDIETMLPDGWAEGDDIFAEGEWTGKEQADESDTDPVQEPEEGDVEETDDTAPTTEQDTDSDDNGETQAEAPTPEQTTEEKPNSRYKFKAKYDREERDVEIDLEADVPVLWQKAENMDRTKAENTRISAENAELRAKLEAGEEMAKILGHADYAEMIGAAKQNYMTSEVDRLIKEGMHEEAAKDLVSRRMADAKNLPQKIKPEPEPETVEQPAAPNGAQTRDIRTEIATLFQVRPDLTGKQVPREVLDAARAGKHILAAYTEWEIQQAKAEATKLRKENEIYKQNAASAAKAPVKGVSGGGATGTKAKDPFEEGFDSDDF